MKTKFKILMLFLAFVPMCLNAANLTKRVHKSYQKSAITALNISNKFGTVEINDFGGDSVSITVNITVENKSEAQAKKLLDMIAISIERNGGLLSAKTEIDDNFKSNGTFNINYKINVPKDRSLTVSNKFGNVAIQALDAPGNLAIAYGNLTAGTLNSPGNSLLLELAYGKADIASVNKITGDIKYSKLYIGKAGNMNLTTKYSTLNIEELKELKLESKYDGAKLGKVGTINAISKYTNYTIDELADALTIDTGYGSVRVEKVLPSFKKIEITNSYGGISLGMEQLSYQLDASCDHCDIQYPVEQFHGNRKKDNTNLNVQGQVGKPGNEQKVVIYSRYGGIKLNN
ncbi:MAG: hypothetical protein ACK5JD_06770 [Mangrovibacterium sp.]